MAEEAKDSPRKGRPRRPPCEFPEGALDLLKQLTEGKLSAKKGSGMMTWNEVVRVMNENFTPVNKMHYPKFTYMILQPIAVENGWYTPSRPTPRAGRPKGMGNKAPISTLLARNPEWKVELEKFYGALPKPLPRGSITAAYAHMKEKFPDFAFSKPWVYSVSKKMLGEGKSFFEVELDEEEYADIESMIAEEAEVRAMAAEVRLAEAEAHIAELESQLEQIKINPDSATEIINSINYLSIESKPMLSFFVLTMCP